MWVLYAVIYFVLGLLMIFGPHDTTLKFIGGGQMVVGLAWLIRAHRTRRRTR